MRQSPIARAPRGIQRGVSSRRKPHRPVSQRHRVCRYPRLCPHRPHDRTYRGEVAHRGYERKQHDRRSDVAESGRTVRPGGYRDVRRGRIFPRLAPPRGQERRPGRSGRVLQRTDRHHGGHAPDERNHAASHDPADGPRFGDLPDADRTHVQLAGCSRIFRQSLLRGHQRGVRIQRQDAGRLFRHARDADGGYGRRHRPAVAGGRRRSGRSRSAASNTC